MKTLSLETCKAIDALGLKAETEKWWGIHQHPLTGDDAVKILVDSSQVEECCFDRSYPAYTFSELLDILPQIGEKLNKLDVMEALYFKGKYLYWKGDNGHQYTPHLPWQVYIAHHLLDLYLSGGMEAVDAEVYKLVTKS